MSSAAGKRLSREHERLAEPYARLCRSVAQVGTLRQRALVGKCS